MPGRPRQARYLPVRRSGRARKATCFARSHVERPGCRRYAARLTGSTPTTRNVFASNPFAAMTGMSIAAFYRHFKAVTAMAPIQYQKNLRLLKARRMLIFEPRDAAAIAFSVGYGSASQFSGEYARMAACAADVACPTKKFTCSRPYPPVTPFACSSRNFCLMASGDSAAL